MALILAASGQVVYTMLHQTPPGTADRTGNENSTNKNINVMLSRADDWKKIAANPVIEERNMSLIDGSTATIPITAELLRQFYDYSDDQVKKSLIIHHATTHDAYTNLINRRKGRYRDQAPSLIFVTPPSDEEEQYAKSKGVELDLTPIAKDGFVFITHKNNPIDSLTVEQIQSIYTGEITNWKQVGGEDTKIKAYQREKNSGSQTAMEQMVMEGKQMRSPINAKVHVTMGGIVDAVAEYENGPVSIGYTYYYYINNLYKNTDIKIIRINEAAPTDENLISGVYPFSTNYYAVIRKDELVTSPARLLRDYLITPEGQDLIAMAGYCKAVN